MRADFTRARAVAFSSRTRLSQERPNKSGGAAAGARARAAYRRPRGFDARAGEGEAESPSSLSPPSVVCHLCVSLPPTPQRIARELILIHPAGYGMLSDLLHMRGDLDGEIEATRAFIKAGGAPDLGIPASMAEEKLPALLAKQNAEL